jgi:hypothetical protein
MWCEKLLDIACIIYKTISYFDEILYTLYLYFFVEFEWSLKEKMELYVLS